MDRRLLTAGDLTRANLPRDFWEAHLQRLPASSQGPVSDYVRKLLRHLHDGVGLLVTGDDGAGKTSAAAIVLKAARTVMKSTLFLTPHEMREAVRHGHENEDHTLLTDLARQVDVLVLDNLRAEDATLPYVGASYLEELLTSRANWRRITILTTGLDAAGLRHHYPSLAPRIQGYMHHVHVTGPNQRKTRLQKRAEHR